MIGSLPVNLSVKPSSLYYSGYDASCSIHHWAASACLQEQQRTPTADLQEQQRAATADVQEQSSPL